MDVQITLDVTFDTKKLRDFNEAISNFIEVWMARGNLAYHGIGD